ncbi:MAG TPA: hypothetical protein VHV10_14785 [Ktedonobacteraceae bacterium]|jgi:hypothetical protein|nr:hypothetical protein [Ktedonobacteraceae bacterium]
MANNEARQDLDRQKMRDIGRVLGFFSAYSELQTGMATYHAEYDAASLCNPKSLSDPKLLKRQKEGLDPRAIYLKENDCHSLYTEGWNEGHTQGTQAHETRNLELIGEIARLAGRLAPFYTAYTTAENDARDCKVLGEVRAHFIINWRQTGGDKRRRKGV